LQRMIAERIDIHYPADREL